MELIIWIIVIVVIITKQNNKKKKAQQDMQRMPNQGNAMQQTRNQNVSSMQSYGQYSQGKGVPNQNAAQMQIDMINKQRELKHRLQQRYGTAAALPKEMVSHQKPKQQNAAQYAKHQGAAQYANQQGQKDILQRAVKNVDENDYDSLKVDMNDYVADSDDLMREVYDLILMGYQPDLSFARDFVAEGVEMLNSYE